MARGLPQLLGRIIWPLMVVTLVGLAIYVSSGRLAMRAISNAQSEVSAVLSSVANGDVSIGAIKGEMAGFSPRIQIEDLAIRDDASGEWLNLPSVSIRLDAWASLLSGGLRFDEVLLTKPVFRALPGPRRQDQPLPPGLEGFLNGFERLVIREARLLESPQAETQSLLARALTLDLDMVREGSRRDLKISLHSDEGEVFAAEGFGTGDPRNYKKFSGEFHGFVTGDGLGLAAQALGVTLAAEGSANFWLSVSQERADVTLQTDFKNIIETGTDRVVLEGVSFSAALEGVSDQPHLWIEDLKLAHTDEALLVERLQCADAERGWQCRSRELEIAPLIDLLLASEVLPEKASKILATLNPSGRIEAISVETAQLDQPLENWAASIVVADATTQPYRTVPGLGGIDASIVANQDGAEAWVLTEDFALDLPGVYEVPITLQSVTGVLSGHWQKDALFLEDGLFLAAAPDHTATVQFEIDIPFFKNASIEREMRLAVALSEAPISVRDAYVPKRLPTPAYQWLKAALPAGQVESAAFLWFGGFRPYGDPSQTMQLAANLSDVTLEYQKQWPQIELAEGLLRLDDTDIDIWSSKASTEGLILNNTSVGLRLRPERSWLQVRAHSESDVNGLKQALYGLPPFEIVRPLLDDLTTTGAASTDLMVGFDVRDIAQSVEVEVDVDLASVTVDSALLGLTAERVSGGLSYETERGFESDDLGGVLFGRELKVEMKPELSRTADALLAAQLNFDLDIKDIMTWRSVSIVPPIDGVIPMEIMVTVADQITVEVASDLEGARIDLPRPWGKARESSAPLRLVWHDRGWADWEVFWFGRFSATVNTSEGELSSASIDLTPRTRPPKEPQTAAGAGIHITGLLPQLDLVEWFDTLTAAATGEAPRPAMTVDELRVEQLLWRGQPLGSLNLSVVSDRESFSSEFMLPWLRGSYHQQIAAPISESAADFDADLERILSIERLDVSGIPEFENPMGDETEMALSWEPLPVTISNVYRGSNRLGGIDFTVADLQPDRWHLTGVAGDLIGATLLSDSQVAWQRSQGGEVTSLALAVEFNNLGSSLESLGVEPIVQTRGGAIDIDWSWTGSPGLFDLKTVSGSMDLTMESGSFVSANAEAAGAMRLLSLMNLAGLFQRANINQLFDPGVTFDRAAGTVEFNQGALRIPGFSVEGSGGYFTLASDIDLREETVDGELVVTLPLVDNIPWVAALAGGLPIAAGAYVISKVFEEQVNQLSSGVYSVSGDLNNPEVIFRRVFDAEATAPAPGSQSSKEPASSSPAR
jgi:uncharacterized protein YhdP